LISGERRLRASTLIGINNRPCIYSYCKWQMNGWLKIQRHDLDPIEIALSYQRLIDTNKLRIDEKIA
jgi:ParB family chromosome partitioning protein